MICKVVGLVVVVAVIFVAKLIGDDALVIVGASVTEEGCPNKNFGDSVNNNGLDDVNLGDSFDEDGTSGAGVLVEGTGASVIGGGLVVVEIAGVVSATGVWNLEVRICAASVIGGGLVVGTFGNSMADAGLNCRSLGDSAGDAGLVGGFFGGSVTADETICVFTLLIGAVVCNGCVNAGGLLITDGKVFSAIQSKWL